MRDRRAEHPPTFTTTDVLRAHAASVVKLTAAGWSPIPSSLDLLSELRRAKVKLERDALFEVCAELGLPLADAPTERETRARRKY